MPDAFHKTVLRIRPVVPGRFGKGETGIGITVKVDRVDAADVVRRQFDRLGRFDPFRVQAFTLISIMSSISFWRVMQRLRFSTSITCCVMVTF